MLNAQEASKMSKERAIALELSFKERNRKETTQLINQAVELGEFSTKLLRYRFIDDKELMAELLELGYTFSNMDSEFVVLSWPKE